MPQLEQGAWAWTDNSYGQHKFSTPEHTHSEMSSANHRQQQQQQPARPGLGSDRALELVALSLAAATVGLICERAGGVQHHPWTWSFGACLFTVAGSAGTVLLRALAARRPR